jgi:surface polysaccharide O-acyltransferase-like enzyme
MKKHITYFDFIRGIAILMVVGIHTFNSTSNFETFQGGFQIIFRQILNCAVPVFLALSGFFLGRKKFSTKTDVFSFWQKQISKVYLPCLIWSLPLFLSACFRGGNIANQLVLLFVCGYSIYYFVALIVQYYILLPFLQSHKKIWLIVAIIISTISIVAIKYIMSVKGISLPLILYAGPFTTWFVFYMLGVYYSDKEIVFSLRNIILFVCIGFVLECLETYWLLQNYDSGFGIKLSSFIFSFGIILLVLHPKTQSLIKIRYTSLIVYIGKISFGIYLTHCYIITLLKVILPFESWILSWLLVVLITMIIIMLSRKILPSWINRYLGFI